MISHLCFNAMHDDSIMFPYLKRYPDNCRNGHDPEWTQFRMDTIPNERNLKWIQSQVDTITNRYNPEQTHSE